LVLAEKGEWSGQDWVFLSCRNVKECSTSIMGRTRIYQETRSSIANVNSKTEKREVLPQVETPASDARQKLIGDIQRILSLLQTGGTRDAKPRRDFRREPIMKVLAVNETGGKAGLSLSGKLRARRSMIKLDTGVNASELVRWGVQSLFFIRKGLFSYGSKENA